MFAVQILYEEITDHIEPPKPKIKPRGAIRAIIDEEPTVKKDIKVHSILLDTVNATNIEATSELTTHPVINGDVLADHMYREPVTLTVSGVVSNCKRQGVVVDSDSIRLADLQKLLLGIKDNGYLCEIVKFSVSNSDDIRFSTWSQMALKSITFTEGINTLGYSLTFSQVLMASIDEPTPDITDDLLPNITEPKLSSFTDALIDWSQITEMLFKLLWDYELMTKEFVSYIQSLTKTQLIAVAVGVGIGLATAGTIAGLVAAGMISGPVGWVALAVVASIAIAAVLVTGIAKIIDSLVKKAKYRVEVFKYYKKEKKTQKEVQRFMALNAEIRQHIEALNDYIKVYKISSEDDQECTLQINDRYYIFEFTTNNTSHARKCSVIENGPMDTVTIANLQNIKSAPKSFDQCRRDNALFITQGKTSYVYVVNPTEDFKLSNCMIVVSDINPETYTEKLTKILQNALLR